MKLAIQNASLVWGGNEKWFATLASGLVARGHEVVVACPPGAVSEGVARLGLRSVSALPRGAVDVVGAARFARWLRRERPDALLLTSWRPLSWSAWAARRAGVPRTVVRLGIVRAFPSGPRAVAFRRGVDAMIVNSAEIRDTWRETAPPDVPAGGVHVVFNGLHPRDDVRPALRDRLRAELGVREGTVVIGGAGHLAPRKGFDTVLRAFASAALRDALLVIVGDGVSMGDLRALADSLGVAGRVRFLGHRGDGPDVIAGCDAFVLGSRNEGMANVMLEAMAAGVPVVATDVSGVRQALGAEPRGAPAGWIVPPDDAAAMATALREVAEGIASGSAGVTARAGEGVRRVRERFGVERMVRECESILFP